MLDWDFLLPTSVDTTGDLTQNLWFHEPAHYPLKLEMVFHQIKHFYFLDFTSAIINP